jgi:hypothetical protein
LLQALADLRAKKEHAVRVLAEARKAGTRQDRGEMLEKRFELLCNAQVREVEWVIPDYCALL